tara:strand:- start:7100 stop:7900 length:801 start_codon:yes stop_codon:yes gene_type:complete
MARKRAQAFRTITEVSDWLDTPSHVLRFWESKFPQIKPVKRAGGRRYYRPEDLKLIGGIKVLLHDKGTTIAAVKDMIKEDGESSVETHSPEPTFPEKGRRKLRKAAKLATSEDAHETQDVVVETPKDDKTDVLKLGDDTPHVLSDPVTETIQPVFTPTQRDAEQTPAQALPTAPLVMDTIADAPAPDTTDHSEPQRENNARDFISNAISRVYADETADGLANSTVAELENLKARSQIADKQILDIEDMYFQLQRIRNRMKRRLDAM